MAQFKYIKGNQYIDVHLEAEEALGTLNGPLNLFIPSDSPGNREFEEIQARVAAGTLTIESYAPPVLTTSQQIDRCIRALHEAWAADQSKTNKDARMKTVMKELALDQPADSLPVRVAAAIKQSIIDRP